MPAGPYEVDVHVETTALDSPVARVQEAVRAVLADEGVVKAQVSVAIVDDAAIHQLNREYLNHDCPTDVLSFLLSEGDGKEADAPPLEGEIIVSAETAVRCAGDAGWSAEDELLLYVIHGALHLCGYDDQVESDREVMRRREADILKIVGIRSNYGMER